CEHIRAVDRADEIFAVPGIDVIFVGPNDLAASMRSANGSPPTASATSEVMSHILTTCRKHGVAPGLHCMDAAEPQRRIADGWQFLAVGSELRMMMDGAGATLKTIGREAADTARY